MRKLTKRSTIVAAAAATAMAASGIAYAYYQAGVAGSGSGSATTQALADAVDEVTFAADGVTGLVPGGSDTATLTFTNPNTFSVAIPAKTVSVAGITTNGACSSAEALLSGTGSLGAQTLAAGATTTVDVLVTMANSPTVDQTACAGKTLTVNYSATDPS